VLYLTFDDGPSSTWTPKVLAVLARFDAHATFFQVGNEVRLNPRTAALVRTAGHRVGSHTSHHRRLTGLDDRQLVAELRGGAASSCLRPPYGAVDARVRRVARSFGQQIVLWDVDTRDWTHPGAAKVATALVRGARPGRVVLMHDGGGNRSQTVAGLAAGLKVLSRKGYHFESLPQC
jgi:peptidoglycan/xylan/chitin deacetylase (PgdA/CDA1 family)